MSRDRRRELARFRLESLEGRRLPTAFTVISAADSGPGSLRQAILAADADTSTGVDTIGFAITVPATITPASPLPAITRPVLVNGSTEPGYAAGTPAAPGLGSPPVVVLDGSLAGSGADGLTFSSATAGGGVRGLAIVRFGASGIVADNAGSLAFTGNYLGVEPDGVTAAGNHTGIVLASPNDSVGAPGLGNLISGNAEDGVSIQIGAQSETAHGALIAFNEIGVDASGEHALGNGNDGIDAPGAGQNLGVTIGGTAAGAGNVISGNKAGGIASPVTPGDIGFGTFNSGATGLLIEGNSIGTDRAGTHALGNLGAGIDLDDVSGSSLNDTIGGTAAGAGNVISGNGGDAIHADGVPDAFDYIPMVTGLLIQGNAIGTDPGGTLDLGNGGIGVNLAANQVQGNTIGGSGAGAGNLFGFNKLGSIAVPYVADNSVFGNRFVGGALSAAIDLSASAPDPSSPAVGPIRYTLTVTNRGPDAASNLVLDLGDAVVVSGPGTATPPGSNLYTIPSLAAGASAEVVLDVPAPPPQVGEPATVSLAVVGLDQADADTTHAEVSVAAVPSAYPVLSVVASSPTGPATANRVATVTYTVTNTGTAPASDVELLLDGDSFYGSPHPTLGAVRISQGTVNDNSYGGMIQEDATFGTIAPGGSATVSIDFTATAPETVAFSAETLLNHQAPPSLGYVPYEVVVGPTFTVTTAADSGPGSLRQAIEDADADTSGGVDTISFAIAGPSTIAPASPLPAITRPITLDGTTEPGFGPTIPIVLDGSAAGAGADGLTFAQGSAGSTVSGLSVVRFGGSGIFIEAGGVTVDHISAGVNSAGTPGLGNLAHGVAIEGGSGSAVTDSLIAGNGSDGILDLGSGTVLTSDQVFGNDVLSPPVTTPTPPVTTPTPPVTTPTPPVTTPTPPVTTPTPPVTTPAPSVVLAVSASAPAGPVQVGSVALFEFTVANSGGATATGVVLEIDLAGLGGSAVGFLLSQGTIAAGPSPGFELVNLGPIAPGASASVVVSALAAQPGGLEVAAVATADQPDAVPLGHLALAGVKAVGPTPQASLDVHHGRVDAVFLDFGSSSPGTTYRVLDDRGGRLVPLPIRATRFDAGTGRVTLELASPLPTDLMPIEVQVGGPVPFVLIPSSGRKLPSR